MLKLLRNRARRRREERLRRRIEQSGLFDRVFYAASNLDVAQSGQDPLLHFIRSGAFEGRSPSPKFDLPAYLQDNPGVRQSGVNPIIDWLEVGIAGGRKPPATVGGVLDRWDDDHYPAKEISRLRSEAIAAGLFDEGYYRSAYQDVNLSGADVFEHYVRRGHRQNRNPSNMFDTHFYRTLYGPELAASGSHCPLVHYLKQGRPADRKLLPPRSTFLPTSDDPLPSMRLGVHLHLFYPEAAEAFASLLRDPGFDYDLFISTCGDPDTEFVRSVFTRTLANRTVTVRKVPNRGRDIAPFLLAFPEIWTDYDAVLHLHTKKSPHAKFGAEWSDWILRHLVGSPDQSRAAVRYLHENDDVAMLFPDNYYEVKRLAEWNGNEARALALLARMGENINQVPLYPHFAAGSMAWFRVEDFAPLAGKLTLDDFEPEEGQVEWTLAHVLERALPLYALARGRALSSFYLARPAHLPTSAGLHARPHEGRDTSDRWMRDTPAIFRRRPAPLAPGTMRHDPNALNISWIVPDFALGAGGHMTIFRIIEFLEAFGHRQIIWIQNPRIHASPSAALAAIRRHYRKLGDRVAVRFLPDDVRQLSGDVVIATDCWTVFPAAAATDFKERFYLIQDYEPYFHPVGENHLIAESTYRLGFAALCAGEWLVRKATEHGMKAAKWDLASDPEFYYARGTPPSGRNGRRARIAFYCRSYTPRRAVNLGLAAFEELSRRGVDFEVLMFGEDPQMRSHGFRHRELGILPPSQLGELYRSADIGVVFSTTNYSLVPLEMMACELPVVEVDTESTRTAFPAGSASLAAPDPLSVADTLERLLNDEERCVEQVGTARRFVEGLDWKASARAVERALRDRLIELGSRPIDPAAVAAPALGRPLTASVVIPTFNGGAVFREVLSRVVAQTCEFDYDVLVVDSSSTDGTADHVRGLGGRVRLLEIDKAQFQHGRTRNLAISMTEGDIAAVLTQDAMPADDRWLTNLVGAFDLGPRIAGVFGRHRAYPEHNPLVARDLERMFDRFKDLGAIYDLDRGLPSFLPRESLDWRMIMHFYSDNNSAMRRSVWRELPYPEVDWGEDQIWAWSALKLGFSKAYADDAVVLHSHDLTLEQQLKIGDHEGRLFATHFGYALGAMDAAAFRAFEAQQRCEATALGLPQSAVDLYLASTRASQEGRRLGTEAVADGYDSPRPRATVPDAS